MKSRAASAWRAQGFERGMNEHTDMADRQLGDLADLLVAEVVLKFELQHFLLPWREGRHDPEQKAACFLAFDPLVRRGLVAFVFFEQCLVEIGHAFFLSADVQGAIAADGKEPLGRRGIRLPAFAPSQLDKRFLHDVACPFAIAQDARGLLQ